MPEEQFDQNFVWYEWSFVAPDDMPADEQHERAEVAVSVVVQPDVRDEEQRWTM